MKKGIKKIFIIITFIFFGISMASAKYVYNYVWDYYLESKAFYFESDKLSLNTEKNSLLTWDGSDIVFNLKNYLTESTVSDYDITYKTTCTILNEESNYISCGINNTTNSTYTGVLSSVSNCVNEINDTDVSELDKTECELNGYTWKIQSVKKEMSFNLYLNDETKIIDEVSVEIKVESTSPYKKIMTGIFYINKAETNESKVIFDYQEYDEYDKLTIINNNNDEKCFSVDYLRENYVVDNDNVLNYTEDSESNISKFELKILGNSNYSVDLFKIKENKEYSISDVNIVEKGC